MRKALGIFLLLLALPAWAQVDPQYEDPTVVWSAANGTRISRPYAVLTAVPATTLQVQIYSGGGAGTLSIKGTLDPEAEVQAGTADWTEIYSTTTLDEIVYIEDPPAYLRFDLTYSSGTIKVQIRGATLRKIMP